MSTDVIDKAIDAAAAAEAEVELVAFAGEFNDTRRPFALQVPSDLTDGELGALIECIVRLKVKGEAAKRAAEAKRPRLFDALGGPLRPS